MYRTDRSDCGPKGKDEAGLNVDVIMFSTKTVTPALVLRFMEPFVPVLHNL